MTNLESITYPFKCVSYYVSSKSSVDNKDSYTYWFRGKMIRIVADKPFARGDVLIIKNISNTANNGILISAVVDSDKYENYPVLNFISTRLVYNKYSDFEFNSTSGIKILKVVEQTLDDNYSVCFIVLTEKTGSIKAVDKNMNNYFDINITLNWLQE